MRIFLKPPEGKKKDEVELEINADELIESVRKRIFEKKNIDCHKLIHRGVTLKDDRTLRSYDVPEGATLIVQGQYYGQYLPMGVTPQMEKRKAEEALLEEAPAELAPEAKRAATAAAAENLTEAKIPWVGIQCAAWGEKGMRRQMEDEHLICTSMREQCPALPKERDFALFAILDGHGGKQVAGFVKTYLAVELGHAFAAEEPKDQPLSDKKLKKAVETTFQRIDSRIATELPGCYDGSTAVVVLVNEETVICVNLGDSMAYLCRKSEEEEIQAIPLQMRQHKCWMMKEKERILRSGGAVENGRINGVLEVSRAFGDITLKKFGVLCTPEYMKFKIDLSKEEFVLLACDGFWNAWTAAEALEHTKELIEAEAERSASEGDALDLKGCCRELVQHVVEEKKAQDNVSVLLLHFLKEGPK
mmetsp:Transcript_41426/g.104060  ORF Transcript_41426/g.104060 Transcript_41426/m.104060 type:complete len:418 (-) Transcript_41426:71-1324(-)|eukprot:CAMPEP_0115177142 /NCGR_PEP_ID=MMETSP0270-20121206/5230_1 /TAXON_ID=71861 /ORGANISM="Scrippsiella trochoidea, Strain CCMP3099" /LENGTH=417 /DNA_ID=CAMNT_0002590059 /DNA_START=18 /DNA_END=1271 /DNA_ORIENTATION=-